MLFIRKIWFWRNETFAYRVKFRKTKINLAIFFFFFLYIEILQKVFCYVGITNKNETKRSVFLEWEKTKCSITKKRNVDIPNPYHLIFGFKKCLDFVKKLTFSSFFVLFRFDWRRIKLTRRTSPTNLVRISTWPCSW